MYTHWVRKNACEKRLSEAREKPHKWLRLAHPSKIALSFGLGQRPWMTDRTIMRVCMIRNPWKRETVEAIVKGVRMEMIRIIEWRAWRWYWSILCLSFLRRSGASQLVILIAAVSTLMRFVALKFLFNKVTGMPIITATFWTVSRASAGCLACHVSALALFVVRTFRCMPESWRSLSHWAKVPSARPVGMLSVSQELDVFGMVRRHTGSKEGGAEGAGALWMGSGWDEELCWPVQGGVDTSAGSSPATPLVDCKFLVKIWHSVQVQVHHLWRSGSPPALQERPKFQPWLHYPVNGGCILNLLFGNPSTGLLPLCPERVREDAGRLVGAHTNNIETRPLTLFCTASLRFLSTLIARGFLL